MRVTNRLRLAVLLMLAALAGCDTLNVGNSLPGGHFTVIGAITVPTGRLAGETGEFSVTWTTGSAPYTIA